MKKYVFLLTFLMSLSSTLFANNDGEVPFEDLPSKVQFFIQTYFSDEDFEAYEQNGKLQRYYLSAADGKKVVFNHSGDCIDIDCQDERVPSPLIPVPILNYIGRYFGYAIKVVHLEFTTKGCYNVGLSNGVQLKFNKKYKKVKSKSL